MFSVLSYIEYRRQSGKKEKERKERITDFLNKYTNELAEDKDKIILSASVATIDSNVHQGTWRPLAVLHAYTRRAVAIHAQVNCITELMFNDAEQWAAEIELDAMKKRGPLCGVPVSLKDTVAVAGYDATLGYASWVGKPIQRDSPLVRLLKDAGAILYVKTTIPTTLLSFESYSGLFGRTLNPHNKNYSPGGSSGGEAALLAAGGSRIGIGSDVAGSVRVPAHYSGVYAIRSSKGRFPIAGNASSMPGQEGVPAVCSPMARTLEDLESFWKAVFEMEPWNYDHTVLKMPWKPVGLDFRQKIGVMWDDGVVPLTPACRRALTTVINDLKQAGHEIVEFPAPSPVEGLEIASKLLLADGVKTVLKPLYDSEPNDPGMSAAAFWFQLPRILQRLYSLYIRYVRRDRIYAYLLNGFHQQTVDELYVLVKRREAYRAKWHEAWNEAGIDLLVTAPNALPAVPHKGMKTGWRACGYTFLFNLLDYTAGVMPITKVSALTDGLSPLDHVNLTNSIARDAYAQYDATKMDGLPVGVQIVGRRLEEEKVLAGMKLVQRLSSVPYELLEL